MKYAENISDRVKFSNILQRITSCIFIITLKLFNFYNNPQVFYNLITIFIVKKKNNFTLKETNF